VSFLVSQIGTCSNDLDQLVSEYSLPVSLQRILSVLNATPCNSKPCRGAYRNKENG